MKEEDALKEIVDWLRGGNKTARAQYGYDIYLTNLVEYKLVAEGVHSHSPNYRDRMKEISPIYFNAAWELCRRGILRPGIRSIDLQSTSEGSAGVGFSITSFGRLWLQESQKDIFVPTEPERFGQILGKYTERFGMGFHSRAQEAIRCYGAHAYLACCSMCGAASESILLAIAIEKENDEDAV